MTDEVLQNGHDQPVTGNTRKTRPENRLYFPALDGLRGLAVLLVFAQHYLQMPWGWTGVDLFFVLSGFLITGILFDTRNAAHRVRNFYVRRALRIFPLYYGLLLGLLALTPVFHWQWNHYWLVWPAYLGNVIRFVHPYLHDLGFWQASNGALTGSGAHHPVLYLGHLWSLSLEEQFYLAWPWVVFAVKDRRRLTILCGVAVVVEPILRIAATVWLPHRFTELEITYSSLPFRIDALLLGGLVALVLREAHPQQMYTVARWFAFVIWPPVLLALLLSARHTPYVYPPWRLTWGLTLVDFIAASLIILCLQPGSTLYRIFRIRPLRWLGRISYGVYIFHDIPHVLYLRITTTLGHRVGWIAAHAQGFTAVLALVATIAIASLSFRYFESPFLNLKERLAPS